MTPTQDHAALLAEIFLTPSGVFRAQNSSEVDQTMAACRESCSGVCSSVFE